MPKVIFIEQSGKAHVVEASENSSAMNVAVENDVPGIEGDCGGNCACGTCHVHVDPVWLDKVGKPDDAELSMLDFATDVRENSRLSCQIKMTADLDGLILHLPES
ncbi:2Fe-2S iron-sulfur cluster-binding protein [Emcibacter nanhaiensis]|uniref:2Fe-2S iron-sulfur cluster binding domain-containing protein n=1 Tax=Emcibacter nanhaiensis TaxID=1505037 RepID=A0A501PS16_9PROT|nr:2Fe-2S iron-sulfur cluster-binding protein [Emcibacter nanhaiensis]TPD63233.1 2Fe-2S iron-sulfur cluster binding domain-containing protein [Emcibacter nanhaiensis]